MSVPFGYEVPISLDNVTTKGMEHLVNALIGEIALQRAKEVGWNQALESLMSEIMDCVLRLSDQEKTNMLRAIIFKAVCTRWSQLEKRQRRRRG